MIRVSSDTHALIWYVHDDPRLSPAAKAVFEGAAAAGDQIAFSSICLVEIVYLIERWRIDASTTGLVLGLVGPGKLLAEIPVNRRIVAAMETIPRDIVPDMPDRIIAATALFLGVPLISKDRKIQSSQVATIW